MASSTKLMKKESFPYLAFLKSSSMMKSTVGLETSANSNAWMIAVLSLKLLCGTVFNKSIKIYSPCTPKRTSVSQTVTRLIVPSRRI